MTRLRSLIAAGLVDAFGLSLGWTLFILYAAEAQGLAAAGVCGAAMLVGVALSAPATSWVAARLGGRRLLRASASSEALLRVATFALLLAGAPLAVIAPAVALTNVVAWMGYAGMRAEVDSIDHGAGTMTSFVAVVAAVEAAGVAVGAILPVGPGPGTSDALLVVVVALYGLSLLPTFLVAADSRVFPRTKAVVARAPHRRRQGAPLGAGFLVMALASGPTLLSTALAMKLHGRPAVVAAALAFTLGSLLAPGVAGMVERRGLHAVVAWPFLGIGIVVGWIIAPWHVAGLVLAQILSGLSLSAFEGTMDVRVAAERGDREVTSVLAWAASARALGSTLAVGLLPLAIAASSLGALSAGLTVPLAACVVVGLLLVRGRVVDQGSRAVALRAGRPALRAGSVLP